MTSKALVEAIAALVIFLALAGLGMFEVPSDEPAVEAGLRAQAQVILADVPQTLTLKVSGRAITVSGDMPSQQDRRALEAALREIPGVETLNSRLNVLPRAPNFAFELRRGMLPEDQIPEGQAAEGQTPENQTPADQTSEAQTSQAEAPVLSGHVVNGATRDRLAALTGLPLDGLAQSGGPPFEAWDATVLLLVEAAQDLAMVDIALSPEGARLTGTATWPEEARDVEERLAAFPDTLDLTLELTVIDDGAPFMLVAERHPRRGVLLQGKLPPTLPAAELSGAFDSVQELELAEGLATPDQPHLATAMRGAVAVIAAAERGTALVSEGAVVLSALRGDDRMRAEVDSLRAALPQSHVIRVSELPETDPEPFWIQLERISGDVRAAGVLPRERSVAEVAEKLDPGADVSDLRQSPYPDTTGWTDGVDALLEVFPDVVEGAILLEEEAVTVDAVLPDPETADRVYGRLSGLAQGDDIRSYVTLEDDGKLLGAQLTYRPETGFAIAGTLPSDLTAAQAVEILGLQTVTGAPSQDAEIAMPQARAVLERVAPWLGEAERLDISLSPAALSMTAVLSPGVDLPLITPEVEAVLTPSDTAALRLLTDLPPEGTERENMALGLRQVFVAGFWLPVLEFEPSVAECARQTELAIAQEPVRFVSGGARLDARSIRGANLLAAVARVCTLEASFAVGVEGHTDSSGALSYNMRLSQERADAVAAELVKRGVPSELIDTVGYGPTRPVASNETAAGQAQNRRITLQWQDQGQQPE